MWLTLKHDFSLDKLTSNLALHLRKVTEVFELVRKLFSFRLLHWRFRSKRLCILSQSFGSCLIDNGWMTLWVNVNTALTVLFSRRKSKWGTEIHLLHNYLIWIDLLRSWEIVLIIKSYPFLHTFTTVPIRGRCQWRNSYPDFFIRSIFYWRFLSIIWSLLQRAFLVQHSLSQSSILNRLLLQLVKLAIQLLHQW